MRTFLIDNIISLTQIQIKIEVIILYCQFLSFVIITQLRKHKSRRNKISNEM